MSSDAPPPPAPPRRGGGARGCLILLVLFLAVPVLLVFLTDGMALEGLYGGSDWEERVVEDNGAPHRVVIVRVEGIIAGLLAGSGGDSMARSLRKQLRRAEQDATVQGVLLVVDSPGGEVIASDDIHREIRRFQQESGKPVVASLTGLAASGGYYIATACRWIVANELTLTGSIGVILHSYNYRGLMDKVGVRPVIFKSGRFKDMLNPERTEMLPETAGMVQTMVDEAFDRFKTVVREGRRWSLQSNRGSGRVLSPDWEAYADGRILTGTQAFEHGFVDELGNFDRAVERMATILGLGSVREFDLIEYRAPATITSLLGFSAEKRTIELDLGLDLPPLRAGRLYYLSPHMLQ